MNRISRRTILFGLAAAPLGLAVGCGADPAAKSATLAVAGTSRPLPIPPLAESTVDDAGVRHFTLRAGAGTTEIVAGKLTDTWGFNGSILGPTVRAERGESVAFTIDNTLAEPTTVHWHGMHLPAPIRRRPAPDHRSRRTLGTGVDDRPVGVDALVSPTPARIHRTARAARSRRTVPGRRRRHAGVGHPQNLWCRRCSADHPGSSIPRRRQLRRIGSDRHRPARRHDRHQRHLRRLPRRPPPGSSGYAF